MQVLTWHTLLKHWCNFLFCSNLSFSAEAAEDAGQLRSFTECAKLVDALGKTLVSVIEEQSKEVVVVNSGDDYFAKRGMLCSPWNCDRTKQNTSENEGWVQVFKLCASAINIDHILSQVVLYGIFCLYGRTIMFMGQAVWYLQVNAFRSIKVSHQGVVCS